MFGLWAVAVIQTIMSMPRNINYMCVLDLIQMLNSNGFVMQIWSTKDDPFAGRDVVVVYDEQWPIDPTGTSLHRQACNVALCQAISLCTHSAAVMLN
jgi:hypothetical protein